MQDRSHAKHRRKAKRNDRAHPGETVVKLGPAPLPDRIERPLFMPDSMYEWLRDELRRLALPWEQQAD